MTKSVFKKLSAKHINFNCSVLFKSFDPNKGIYVVKSQSKTVLYFFVIYAGRGQIFLKCNLENYRMWHNLPMKECTAQKDNVLQNS